MARTLSGLASSPVSRQVLEEQPCPFAARIVEAWDAPFFEPSLGARTDVPEGDRRVRAKISGVHRLSIHWIEGKSAWSLEAVPILLKTGGLSHELAHCFRSATIVDLGTIRLELCSSLNLNHQATWGTRGRLGGPSRCVCGGRF